MTNDVLRELEAELRAAAKSTGDFDMALLQNAADALSELLRERETAEVRLALANEISRTIKIFLAARGEIGMDIMQPIEDAVDALDRSAE